MFLGGQWDLKSTLQSPFPKLSAPAWVCISSEKGASFPEFVVLAGLHFCNSPNDALCAGGAPGLEIDADIAQGRKVEGQSWENQEAALWRRVEVQTYRFTEAALTPPGLHFDIVNISLSTGCFCFQASP